MDFSKILDALRTPQPPTLQPPARPAAPFVAVGAGAYRTAHIAPDVMPLPRPPWWVRAQAVVLHAIVGRRRAASRAHAEGRAVRVLALVALWSATHGTEYTAERARRAGLEVVVRRYGEG